MNTSELRKQNRETTCKDCIEQTGGKGDEEAMCYLCNGCPLNDEIPELTEENTMIAVTMPVSIARDLNQLMSDVIKHDGENVQSDCDLRGVWLCTALALREYEKVK